MNGDYALDTNIVIGYFGADNAIHVKMKAAGQIFIPSIVLGELYFGARKSGRVAENVRRVDSFRSQSAILQCDADTAHHYGTVKNALLTKGRPLPENDIRIAAIAVQYDLTLVTRDAHFNEIAGLRLESW